MKQRILFSFFALFVCIGIQAQTETKRYAYQMDKRVLEAFIENDTIIYDAEKDYYESKKNYMTKENLVIEEEQSFIYDNNKIRIGNTEYRFRRPIFSNKTYLINNETKEIFLIFDTYYKYATFYLDITFAFQNLDANLQKVLMAWALFKQAEYMHYNSGL